ncbi:hypothetical protein ACEPAH_2714 [Sanghuangporus vaninii]
MPIPTEPVGSLPRPAKLQQAIKDYESEKIDKQALEKLQDDACKDTIERFEKTGSPIISDGEQRASSFATYPVVDTLGGAGLAPCLSPAGQYFAIFDDGHHRQLPKLEKGPFRYNLYVDEYFNRSKVYATKPMKQAVIAPSMLSLLYPLEGEIPGYSREQFHSDLIDECEKDIRKAFAAGASRVSIDFTEGRLACKQDPRNPWTGRNLLQGFVQLNNRVLDRFSAEERKNIGVHVCPGGDCDSVHSKDVPYEKLLPAMFQLNAGYFLLQLASEENKTEIYRLCAEHMRDDANGVSQYVFIGVVNPLTPEIESPESICSMILEAAKYIPKDRLGTTDDCGFSPFSIDEKPKHGGGPDLAREIAFKKIENRVKGTMMASKKLGV